MDVVTGLDATNINLRVRNIQIASMCTHMRKYDYCHYGSTALCWTLAANFGFLILYSR
jgi:hypothetical protein